MKFDLSRTVAVAAVAFPLSASAATYDLAATVTAVFDPGFVSILPEERPQAVFTTQQGGNASASGSASTVYDPPEGSNVAAPTVSLSGAVSGAVLGASSVQALFSPIPLSFVPTSLLTDLPPEFAPPNVDEPLYTTTLSWMFSGSVDLTSTKDPDTWAGGFISVEVLDTWNTDAQGNFLPARQVVREDALGFESVTAPEATLTAGQLVLCGQDASYAFARSGQIDLIYGTGDEGRYQLGLTIGGAAFGAFCGDPNGNGNGNGPPPNGPFPPPFDEPFDIPLMIPLPASSVLLIGALALLAGFRRRRSG